LIHVQRAVALNFSGGGVKMGEADKRVAKGHERW